MHNILIKIFRYDKWVNGIIAGFFIPIVLFAALLYLLQGLGLGHMDDQSIHILRPRTLALLALCINLLSMNGFKTLRWNNSMRGLVISTFILVVTWVVQYGREIF